MCKDYLSIHDGVSLCPLWSKRVYVTPVPEEPLLGKDPLSWAAIVVLILHQPEELVVSDYLLKIFRISIPHMPKTAVKFGQELQLVLQPMIVKPSHNGGVVVSCLMHSMLYKVLHSSILEPTRKCSLHVWCSSTSHTRFQSSSCFGQVLQWHEIVFTLHIHAHIIL